MTAPQVLRLAPELQPWARQPGETPLAYSYFTLYLEQTDPVKRPSARRDLAAVAERLDRTLGTVAAMALRNLWEARAQAHDLAARGADADTALDQDRQLLRAHMGVIAQALNTVDPNEISYSDLVRATDMLIKHRRLIHDRPTDLLNVNVAGNMQVSGPDGDPVKVQLLVEMERFTTLPPAERDLLVRELAESTMRKMKAIESAESAEADPPGSP